MRPTKKPVKSFFERFDYRKEEPYDILEKELTDAIGESSRRLKEYGFPKAAEGKPSEPVTATKKPQYDETKDLISQLSGVKKEPSEQVLPTQPSDSVVQTAQEPIREPSSMQTSDVDALLVGATPLLAGLLTGNFGDAYEASSSGLMTLAKWRMAKEAREAKDKKGTLNVEKVVGPDGKPMFVSREQALGKQAYEKPSSALSLDERKDLEMFKASLKEKEEKDPDYFKNEQNLRKERSANKVVKNTQEISQQFSKIQDIVNSPQSGAGDISLIFAYMKMLDPDSVVREGEQATAQNAGSIPMNIRNQYNRLVMGEDVKLPSEVRKEFAKQAKTIYKGQRKQQAQIDRYFRRLAKKYNLDPENVIVDVQTPIQPDRPDQIQNGYRYSWIDGEYKPVERVE